MAERARHADAVRANQIAIEVIRGVVVEALRIPASPRCLVEVRIRKQPEADDAGWLAVVGADRNGFPACTDDNSRVFARIGERICLAAGIADIEPQAKAIRIGPRGLLETRLIHEPKVFPAIVAAVCRFVVARWRMRRDGLEQIERAEAVD